MNERLKELMLEAGYAAPELAGRAIKLSELLVKKCAYLVNDQQRTTGYTTHAQMLCREFDIEFKEEDYFGDQNASS
jgi:hypothetical protein